MEKRPFCRKCLLDETDENEYVKSVRKYIAEYPQEKRVSDEEYKRRLSICLECDFLDRGTCEVCGCYVEFRALRKEMKCPKGNRWAV